METPVPAPWWHGAVLYQLYVRSWQDSDGDGYGDLRGIISRLDHLAWLGVDGIWLSPVMPSPDADWGYDVSDYLGVHPELGTLADLDELIAKAGALGLAVLLDLVPNHTSSAHPWFVDAASSRDAEHRGYYMWADAGAGGGPPNNWRNAIGDPAWTWDDRTGQYYLHSFLAQQPDLNWWDPRVHAEFREILAFWFDRGVAGFRIDVAQGIYKDDQLRDNPPLPVPDILEGQFGLRRVYSANRPETHGVFRDWRAIARGYDPERLLLGETWVGDLGRLAAFYGQDDELQLGINFRFAFADLDAGQLSAVLAQTMARLPAFACPAWAGSNHDIGRFASRWAGGDERKARLALLMLGTMPGTVVLYYGDELGMTDVAVPPDLQRDKMPLADDSGELLRDRARTPMPWEPGPGGGFTGPGASPWLPLGEATASVAAQRADPASCLHLCRKLIAVRRAGLREPGPRYAPLPAPPGAWAYRAGGLQVVLNMSDDAIDWPGEARQVLLRSGGPGAADGRLLPWEGVIARAG